MEKDEALSVFLIDIDHFKKFNDIMHQSRPGASAGGQGLQEGVREVDLAAPTAARIDRGASGS